MNKVTIITPVYEDLVAFQKLIDEVKILPGLRVTLIAVDDGSIHEPLRKDILEKAGIDGVVLKLKRNVGHQRSLAIGLWFAHKRIEDEETVILMDSDGEDKPSSILELHQVLQKKTTDVVVAERKSRNESINFKAFYIIYKIMFKLFTGRQIGFGNFMVMTGSAVKRLVAMEELPIHIAAAVLLSKLRVLCCPIDRGIRYAGKSKMNFTSLALHGFRGLMIFAEDVLVRVGLVCAAVSLSTLLLIITVISLKFISIPTPGWFSVALGILLLIIMQTGTLALMTLMLTGVVRSRGVSGETNYGVYIEDVYQCYQITK